MKTFKIKNKLLIKGLILVMSLLIIGAPLAALALEVNDGEVEYVYQWNGNGKNSLDCSKAGEGDRPDDGTGWIHRVFTTKGNSTDAVLTLGGSGNGSYSPGEPLEANVWHFYTPYFDVYELTASITLIGGDKGPGLGLVISDYCPGVEQIIPMLTIVKELLDIEGVLVIESELEFEFEISGGVFGEGQIFSFSVDEPKEFGLDDGLSFGVEYLIEEVENEAYQFISISQSSVTLSEENDMITVIIVNQEAEEEEETGSIIIEKLVKAEVDAEEVIPSNKVFFFNIFNHETDELVHGNVELAVIDGVGTVTIDNLPLGIYRVEEVVNGGYQVVLDPEDGVVDLTAEENEVTLVVVNTPRPELVIEKVLLDTEGVVVENSNVEFTVILDGGLFDEQEILFSVNEPAVLDISDGLEFDVPYTVTEVAKEGYIFVSIDPEAAFTLTDEENEVTVTVVNQMMSPPPPPPVDPPQTPPLPPVVPPQTPPPVVPPVIIFAPPVPPQVIVIPPAEPQVSPPPQVVVISPAQPQVVAQAPQSGVDEEDVVAFFVSPEDPLTEPEEVLVVQPAMPLSTPRTGGIYINMILVSLALLGSGFIIRKKLMK